MTTPTSLDGQAVGAVVKNEVADGGDLQNCEDLRWMEDYASECNVAISPSVMQLKVFKDILVRVTHLASREEVSKLDSLCGFLPGAIQRTIDGESTPASSEEHNMYVLEVLCEFVEFVVAAFSFLSSQATLCKPNILKLSEALSIALDSERKYYKLRKGKHMRGVQVLPSRLESVLQIPGIMVERRSDEGSVIDRAHYFCSCKGVITEEACECCKTPLETDAVIVYLSWLLAKTTSGSGYEYILRMLCSPKQLTLQILSFLLRPLCRLVKFKSGSDMWREGILHMETNFRSKFKDQCMNACSNLFQHLDAVVVETVPKNNFAYHEAFSIVVNHLHTITCWGHSYFASPELDSTGASLGRLLERVWERLLDARIYHTTRKLIGAAIEAMNLLPTNGNKTLLSLKWLEEKQIIPKLLLRFYPQYLSDVPQVKRFLTNVATAGVVITENYFVRDIRSALNRPTVPVTALTWDVADLILGAMLDILDISSYSAVFLEVVLEWLETRKAQSPFNGSRIVSVLKKLLTNDRDRRWESRFLSLFSKHASTVSENDLLDCLNKVADHYHDISQHVTGAVEDSYMQTIDEQAKLLEDSSNADRVTYVSTDMANSALNYTHLHVEKAGTWKDKEIDIHRRTSPTLTKSLGFDFPFSRHGTAKEFFDRLILAQKLSVGFNPNKCNILASALTTAMSPELQSLEAIKKEISHHCLVLQRIEKIRENHVRQYDEMKQKQHETLVTFLEACRKEEDDVVFDALYQKAKVVASVKKACVIKDMTLSSEDILQRVLQNAGGAFKEVEVKLSQVEAKHKESLERLPNNECALCMTGFSLKRKRACLDPCGHASACVDCATQEWKRTKSCPMCKTSIEKPIAVPHKLFF
ncbi:hypothetical protein KC19_4G176800 [Ceratodon purpureus]|uniref:RING-type domain-containing protein n=1 Tax=Ceratodon purpureus TaxID=3225 RepID=A0A8T0IC61_CERPU|nr:hypothetical protein KC19_4G176800 [Ceratodon purpureus]